MRPAGISLTLFLAVTLGFGLEYQPKSSSELRMEHGSLSFRNQADRSGHDYNLQTKPTILSEGLAWPDDPLKCFQVAQPILGPSGLVLQGTGISREVAAEEALGEPSCSMLLMEHSFGFSYGKPFVGPSYLTRALST